MAVDYEKQVAELYKLYDMNTNPSNAQCVEQTQDNLQDLAMPPHWRAWTLTFLAASEERWTMIEVNHQSPDYKGVKMI
jgi:hypothetical protein